MKPGKVALLRFPHANLATGKLRPVLLIAQVPGPYSDWLVAMVSTNLEQALPKFDEVITRQDYDFAASGLKETSVIRIGRLAVVEAELLLGEMVSIAIATLSKDILTSVASDHHKPVKTPRGSFSFVMPERFYQASKSFQILWTPDRGIQG